MNYLLYILPFKNEKHFKFGITRVQDLKRVKNINKIYTIDIDKSFIYRGHKDLISKIECRLKEFEHLIVEDYIGMDGYTEIRNISELNNTINIIEQYDEFNLIKEPLKKYNNLVTYKNYTFKPKTKINVKTGGSNIPDLELNMVSVDEIEIPYESTIK
jgi:hypothetical protein